jgi:putative transposase
MRLRELASGRPRYGYRRLTILLRREGWHVNAKRVYRLYREEGLTVRIQRRKKLASHARIRPVAASRVNDRWSMDFVTDSLSDGGKIRVLTVLDSFTRGCLALKVSRSLSSREVTGMPDEVISLRGSPRTIQVDNGSEFTSNHFDAWAYCNGIEMDFIRPGKPVDNAQIESFNGRLRDACLNARWFESVDDARQALQAWRRDYNQVRPHSSLGNLPPAVFAAQIRAFSPSCAHRPEKRNPRLDQPRGQAQFDLDPRNLAGSI